MCRPLQRVWEGSLGGKVFFLLRVFVEIEGVGVFFFSFLKRFKFRPGAQESSSKELK